MSAQESLSLLDRFEFTHSSLTYTGNLVGLLRSNIRIPIRHKEVLRNHLATGLQIYINPLTVMVDSPLQVVLLAFDVDEHFVDEEGLAVAPGPLLRPA